MGAEVRFSVNLLLFSDTVDAEVLDRFGLIGELGFDGVEVPIFNPASVDVDAIRRRAEDCGLALTGSGALPPGTKFYGEDPAPREAAACYFRDAVRVVSDLGAGLICGPLYKPVGDSDESAPLAQQREETAKRMAPLAAEAGEKGVALAFEPLNRFETNLLNTTDQGVDFCRRVGGEAAGLLLDTFHMHIEEKDSAAAVGRAGEAGFFTHFHASENDRGVAGSGQVAWDEVAAALAATGYDGWVVLESFSQSNTAIRTAVSCWRPFYSSPEEFMREGLAFVRRTFAGTGARGHGGTGE